MNLRSLAIRNVSKVSENMFSFLKPSQKSSQKPFSSELYDEKSFYQAFINDISNSEKEVIIESPYITKKRLEMLKPAFDKLVERCIPVFIITRASHEHDAVMAEQSEAGICYFEALGVQVLLIKGGHHRKLAMIDRKILWEGSLNILSQIQSREFMRRIDSKQLSEELFQFLQFDNVNEFKRHLDLS